MAEYPSYAHGLAYCLLQVWLALAGMVCMVEFFCGKTFLCEFFVSFGKGNSLNFLTIPKSSPFFNGLFLNRPKMVGLLLGSHSKSFFGVSLLIAVYVILYTCHRWSIGEFECGKPAA